MKKIFITTLFILASFISIFASGHIVSITSSTNVMCFGTCTGSATAVVSGGVGPYSYSWSGPSGYTSYDVTATNMCAGTYTVTATDLFDMSTATVSVTINSPNQLVLYFNSCGSNYITTGVYGGSPPYSYLWDTTTGNQTTQTAIGLSPGTYSVTIYDSHGCTITGTHALTNIPPFTVTITNTPNTCNCNGSINLSTTGTYPPFTYCWSNGMSGSINLIHQLCPSTYNVTVSDSHGCTDTYSTTVADSSGGAQVNIVLDSIININCVNNNNLGSIYVHGAGGVGPYSYIWSNAQVTSGAVNLDLGYYTVTVSDIHNCSEHATYHIQNTYNLYSSVYVTNANCTNNGSSTVMPTGVNPPFTFLWNDLLSQTTATASNLPPGLYQVTITDAIGCTISPTIQVAYICLNVIQGRVYLDFDQDCIQDAGEPGLPNMIVNSNNYQYGNTNINGDYIIHTSSMNNTVSINSNQLNGYTLTCPINGTLNINFVTLGDYSTGNNIGLYPVPTYSDLRIFPAWTGATPGFNKTYKLYGSNISPYVQNAILRLTYDSVLQYTSSNLGGVHNLSSHTVEWTANNISPWNYWYPGAFPQASFYVPTTVSISDSLYTCVEISPIVGDINPYDNTRCFNEPVTGSFDPNSKEVLPRGQGTQGFITTNDSILYYTIHFQNTGNDTAFTVVVVDTLSQYLNPGTIVPGASSHPYTFTLTDHGTLTFRFDNILLPDSNVNESGSNGFFNYTVNLKPNLPIGTVIENEASIFFDFNAPIVTNTTINTIASPLQIKEIENNITVTVFPNPFSDYTNFKIQNGKSNAGYSVEIYDMLGKRVKSTQKITENDFKVSAKGLEKGIYLYKVIQNKEVAGFGKIIIE